LCIPVEWDIGVNGISASLMAKYLHCHYKFLISINKYYNPGKMRQTFFGNLCHEVLFQAYDRGEIPDSKKLMYWLSNWRAERRLSGSEGLELLEVVNLAFIVLSEYFKVYESDFRDNKVEAAESQFSVMYRGILMRGKKDLVYRDKLKKLWLMETKTRSKINAENMSLRLMIDLQNLFYVTAEELEFKETVEGVLYNVIRKPGLKSGKDNPRAFRRRLAADVRSRREHYFLRYPTVYNRKDKERFLHDFIIICSEIMNIKNMKSVPYRSRVVCEVPYPCEFLKACAEDDLGCLKKQKDFNPELKETK